MKGKVAALRIGGRTGIALVLAGAVSVVAFAWPLLLSPTGGVAHVEDAPLLFGLILPLVIGVVLAQMTEGGMDTKAVAMLGVLSALGAGLRPLGAGIAGVEPVFFLLIVAGRVFGPGFGFALGSSTLFASALLTGGVGPWLPFQMLAASWVGMGAGLLPKAPQRIELLVLAAYGALSSFLFGLAMNLSFWPFTLGARTDLSFVPGDPVVDNIRRFLVFDLTTSLGWDVGRAFTTSLLILFFGRSVLQILRRAVRRAGFERPVEFEPAEVVSQPIS